MQRSIVCRWRLRLCSAHRGRRTRSETYAVGFQDAKSLAAAARLEEERHIATSLTDRFERALVYAAQVHGGQLRKGTEIPYISHLLAVAGLAIEAGADEDQAIAALLHDAVEDQGGPDRLRDIRARFGERVAGIVAHCTDTDEQPKPPWRERKERYIAAIEKKPADALLVSLADKTHNAEAILADAHAGRAGLWESFNGGREGTLWYYSALSAAFRCRLPGRAAERLQRAVEQMEQLASRAAPTPAPQGLPGAT